MRKVSFGEKARYQFDNTMSRGTIALIGWLAVLSLVMILIIAIIVSILQLFNLTGTDANLPPNSDLLGIAWMGLMRTLDSGTMGGDTGSPLFLLSMLAMTVGGIFVVSSLIGVISSGVETKMDELRKGRSAVLEENQTLILGWSEEIYTVVSELVLANANQKRPVIVILSSKDKVEMEDAIREKVGNTGKTRIIVRSGSPIDPVDLDIVNPQGSRSIIILAPEDEDPDSQVIKTLLALTNSPKRRPEPYHIVAEIRERKNMEVARMVGGSEVQLVEVGDIISRVIVQTCRQSGLSVVYTELLDFGGDEIYFKEEPGLLGQSFGTAMLSYEDSAVIGIQSSDGVVQLNPPVDRVIGPGDKVIVVSEDDDTVKLAATKPQIDDQAIVTVTDAVPQPERTLIIGWNHRATTIINELDNYVAAGSTITVVADDTDAKAECDENCGALRNQELQFYQGDTTDRNILNSLGVENYAHVIVLCYSDKLEPQRADARTLITLLHLRDIENKLGDKFSIVSEMVDDRNRELAEVTKADDFIVSDKLISLMLAQVSENKDLNPVFADLFDPEGSEIYLKPAENYVAAGRPVNFYTVVESARRRGEAAIGYSLKANQSDASQSFGVVVNPDKSKAISFSPGDRIVVLADS